MATKPFFRLSPHPQDRPKKKHPNYRRGETKISPNLINHAFSTGGVFLFELRSDFYYFITVFLRMLNSIIRPEAVVFAVVAVAGAEFLRARVIYHASCGIKWIY